MGAESDYESLLKAQDKRLTKKITAILAVIGVLTNTPWFVDLIKPKTPPATVHDILDLREDLRSLKDDLHASREADRTWRTQIATSIDSMDYRVQALEFRAPTPRRSHQRYGP